MLGPLGRDPEGEFAFLAREIPRDRLVVLKRGQAGAGGQRRPAGLQVIERLDASVPPPAGACPVCQAPFSGWQPACPDCGADLAGSIGSPGASREQLLDLVRQAAQGFEVLGDMPRAAGGANVYFARESKGGTLVALRLEPEQAPGRRSGFTVAATRMMRPKLLYGTVGGDARESVGSPVPGAPLWTPVPSGGASLPTSGPAERTCPQCGESFGPELRFCPRDGAALRARDPSADLVGQILAERYHILAKLGEGGMGQVYLAEHVRMGRRCAVKVMNPLLHYDPDSVSRFNREAANASRITHPNVAAIYDFGESNDLVYLAMEFIEGESLAALLEREPGLTQRRAVEIGRQIAEGLSAAHELGIIHRDLKPDNVMVSRSRSGQDVVKVVDFGIAKATRGGKQTVTRTGYVVGTPAYMSPEQILGDALDPKSDIYSLGCILYEMLTGARPFSDSSGEVSIRQRLTEPAPPPRRVKQHLSRKLDGIVTTAMARSPDQRFHSAAEVRDALAEAATELAATGKSWRSWLPWGRSGSPATELASSAGPVASGDQPGGAFTAPVPLGWTQAGQPPIASPVRAPTVLRHRSARPPRWHRGWIAGGCVAAALVGFGAWKLVSPAPDPARQTAGGPIVLPGSGPPSQEQTDSLSLGTVAAAGPAPEPAASERPTGTVWLAEPLPFGARVFVDGDEVSPSAEGTLLLPPGAHTIRIEAPGYRPATGSARVAAGGTDTVQLRLRAAPEPGAPAPEPVAAEAAPKPEPERAAPAPTSGALVVTGALPPGAEISVDGNAAPPGAREIPVAPGVHQIKVSAPGYRPDSSTVEVKPGTSLRWAAPHLTPIPVAEPVVQVVITSSDTTLVVGDSAQLRAGVKDQAGTYLDRPLAWGSSNPAVARVEPDGKVTAEAAGRTYIRARSGNGADSILVTVPAPPKPLAAARNLPRPPVPAGRPVPATPAPADIKTALDACLAAFGSGDERQIVEIYQARTALDVENLRKILAVALKEEAEFKAEALKTGTLEPAGPDKAAVPLQLRFTWRNNAGVNKKKDLPARLELNKAAAGWQPGACRATEKANF